MSRANGYLIFCYCCLLFSAGIVFGFIFSKGGEVGFVTFLSAASSLATVGAALTAIHALHAWYPQFKHAEKYKLIKEFQLVTAKSELVRAFIYALKDRLIEVVEADHSVAPLSHDPLPDDEMRAWWRHMDSMQYAWRNMIDLLSDEETKLFTTSPGIIDNMTKDLVSEVMDLAYEETDSNRRLKLARRSAYGAEIIAAKYQELEDASRVLLKKLAS
ncbi:hypothetical protein GH769_15120 [Pseudomonas sp. CFSAN084952]|uniref:hypothetical protein n=1 Tax=Pseudomonas TaxID=286 RepID=UPI001299DD4B|nr:hypothetical protein [Pseudomonas sp. CFSAN084952]QGF94522.1 hypothetical protein GH769_15120 [Pseudomonas sp. CFSAN084952]